MPGFKRHQGGFYPHTPKAKDGWGRNQGALYHNVWTLATEVSPVPAIDLSVMVGGIWRAAEAIHVMIGGTWRQVEAVHTNVGGAWKQS